MLSDLGGRDNANYSSLSVSAAAFNSLHLYATYGAQYSAPRGMIDDLDLTSATAPCPGDINGDNIVDLTDLATLIAHFGMTSGAGLADGDLDGDGDVDLTDLATMLAYFGVSC